MNALQCRRLIAMCMTVSVVISDHQLEHAELMTQNSTRSLEVSRQSVTMRWLNHPNRTEPFWDFYLNGVKLEWIKPASWNITRSTSTLQLQYNDQVNFELLVRDEAILTIEAIVRQSSGQYNRLVLSQRARWSVETKYFCDELTEGDECSECSRIAVRNNLKGGGCYLPLRSLREDVIGNLVIPTVVGVFLFLIVIGLISLMYIKTWRERRASKATIEVTQKDSEELTISSSKKALLDKTLEKTIRSSTGINKTDSNQRAPSHHNVSKNELVNITNDNGKAEETNDQPPVKVEETKTTWQQNLIASKKTASTLKGNAVLERVIAHKKAKWKPTVVTSKKLAHERVTPEIPNKPPVKKLATSSTDTVIAVYDVPQVTDNTNKNELKSTAISSKEKASYSKTRNSTSTNHAAADDSTLVKIE